ncbi:uncharacterized protein LOC114653159 [Erpetoichthys calabaricus]|uniref:uncharacterized protein LOC114653159 n=1 Tax=Erpetoichthys calabaricus TaxID=27687 RepID=UPI002234AAD5|nr:uncharacterized protein LOC114653159 [Erpetoichthys calabaricus]
MAVVEQTEEYKRKFVAEVMESLKDGISTTVQLARDMQTVDFNNMENDSGKFRKSILEAKKSLSQAEDSANCQLAKVNEKCISLTCDKNQLEEEEKVRKDNLNAVQKDLQHFEELLRISRDSLNQAIRNRSSAEESVERARQRARQEETNRNIGIGLLFIPFIGPIIGGTMIGVSQKAMEDAQYAARIAQENVDSWSRNVNTYEGNIRDYTGNADTQRNNIESINRRLQEISSKMENLSRMRQGMGEVQKKLKDATSFLTTLAGKMQALEVQTRVVIFFEPLIEIIDDISQYLFKQKYLELFQNNVEPMIKQLKQENARLREIYNFVSDSIQFL